MRYILLVSFPLNIDTIKADTDRLIELVGQRPSGTGAGFGMRDVDFEFTTANQRDVAVTILKSSGGDYTISQHDDVQ